MMQEEWVNSEKLFTGEAMKIFTSEVQARAAKSYALRKLGKFEDLSNAVLFMASKCAGRITGQTLSVSGGYTMMWNCCFR